MTPATLTHPIGAAVRATLYSMCALDCRGSRCCDSTVAVPSGDNSALTR